VSNIPGKHVVKELQKTAILGTAHILRKVLMQKYNRFNTETNGISTIDSNNRIAATLYSVGASRRKLSRVCALFEVYYGERAWKPIGDRLERSHYLSRVDYERKIRSRRQGTDIGKYSFLNRTIQHWNQLPAEVLGIVPCKPITFKKRVRKVIIELN